MLLRSKVLGSRLCLLALLPLLLATSMRTSAAAEAASEAVELSWVRSIDAGACASTAELKRAVIARLGRDPFVESPQQQIDGYVSRVADKWTADLVVRSRTSGHVGKRHLESAALDCGELDQAVVLTVTLIIDPNAPIHGALIPSAVATTHQPKPAPNSEAAPTSVAIDAAPPRSQLHSRSVVSPVFDAEFPARRTLSAGVTRNASSRLLFAASASHDLLARATYALTLRAEVPLTQRLFLETSGAFFPQRVSFSQNTTVGYGLTALGVGTCYAAEQWVTLLACTSAWVGAIHAVPYRGVPDRPGDRLWSAVRADVGYALSRGIFTAELRAFGLVPITRWRFTTSTGAAQWELPWVAPGAEIALGMRLP